MQMPISLIHFEMCLLSMLGYVALAKTVLHPCLINFFTQIDVFVGGQTPLSRAVRKKGFHNPNRVDWTEVNLDQLRHCIKDGKLKTDAIITMKSLRDAGVVGKKIPHGVKILARGAEYFKHTVHLQVSKCSLKAEEAIERNGGTVRLVYYDKTGLRGLLKPEAYLKKGLMIPEPARYIPAKRRPAYDFPGDTLPDTALGHDNRHFETPERKQPGHPGLPPGTGHIKTRLRSTIVLDYGRKSREAQQPLE